MVDRDSSSGQVRRRRMAVATTLLIIASAEVWVILAWNRTGWIGMSLSAGDSLAVGERQHVTSLGLVSDGPGRRAGLCASCRLLSVRVPNILHRNTDDEQRIQAFLTQRPPVGSTITFVQQRRIDGPLETVRVRVEYPLKTESVQVRMVLAVVVSLFSIGVGLLILATRPRQRALWVVTFACWLTGLWVFSKSMSSVMIYSDIVSREVTSAAYFVGGSSDPVRLWLALAYGLPLLLLAAHLHILRYIKPPSTVDTSRPLYGPYLYFVPSLALFGLEAEFYYACCRGLWTREQLATGWAATGLAILVVGHLLTRGATSGGVRFIRFCSYLFSAHASANALFALAAETPARASIWFAAMFFVLIVGAVTITVHVIIRAISILHTPSLKFVRVMTTGLALSAVSLASWFVWAAWRFATQGQPPDQPEWLSLAFVFVFPLVSPWTMLIALNRYGVFGVDKLAARFTQLVTSGMAIVVIELSNDSLENFLGDIGVAFTGTSTIRLALLIVWWVVMRWLIPVDRLQSVLSAMPVGETATVGGRSQPTPVPPNNARSSQPKRKRKRRNRQ